MTHTREDRGEHRMSGIDDFDAFYAVGTPACPVP